MDPTKKVIAVTDQAALDANAEALAGAEAQKDLLENQRRIREEIERLEALMAGGLSVEEAERLEALKAQVPERITMDPVLVYPDSDIT